MAQRAALLIGGLPPRAGDRALEGIKAINELFDRRIEHQRIKKYGEHSKIRTAIREEPVKLAQYLRGEKENYDAVGVIL
ncbi:MAG: hypothetical protein ACP5PX_06250 [Candidatus Hadarchaeum sp.]|uniref:hypothetical protein n=1 Tax=Candidatus Hadarchaeum sp. TaxID=2883567 RepID=UPI003D117CA7